MSWHPFDDMTPSRSVRHLNCLSGSCGSMESMRPASGAQNSSPADCGIFVNLAETFCRSSCACFLAACAMSSAWEQGTQSIDYPMDR
jgi:hypothetical protein